MHYSKVLKGLTASSLTRKKPTLLTKNSKSYLKCLDLNSLLWKNGSNVIWKNQYSYFEIKFMSFTQLLVFHKFLFLLPLVKLSLFFGSMVESFRNLFVYWIQLQGQVFLCIIYVLKLAEIANSFINGFS